MSCKLVILKEFLEENLKKEFIKESKNSANVFILFVFKKNNSLYLCINYKSLNTIIFKNQYLFLLITKIINQVTKANYFSKINLKNIYYQI